MYGESAGRSSSNPVRGTARRRFSEAERSHRTHLHDDPDAWPELMPESRPWRLTRRGWIVLAVAVVVGVGIFTWATSGTCWTGQPPLGYGACPWVP